MNARLGTSGLAAGLALGIVATALCAAPATGTTHDSRGGPGPTVFVGPAGATDIAEVVVWLQARTSDHAVRHAAELTEESICEWRVVAISAGTLQSLGSCDPWITIPPASGADTELA